MLAGCTEDGQGTASFTTYGETFIEEQIPASAVEDGWSITYSRFLVTFRDIEIAETDAPPAATMAGSVLFNEKVIGTKAIVSFTGLRASAYPHVSYHIAPATADTALGRGATDADKALMVSNGYAIYVEAIAQKGAVTKSFKWGFAQDTLNDRCQGNVSGMLISGAIITNGGTDTMQLTIHGDHFFYDDLQSAAAKLRFDNIAAADADGDGVVTLDELSAVKLAAIPIENGSYGTGSAAGIHTLRDFVEALARTVGHFRGEGQCFATPIE